MAEPGELDKRPDSISGPDRSIPPPPVIKSEEWGDWSNLLIDARHLSIGWHNRPARKGGPCYLVGRMTAVTGGTKVIERFPFTDEGWAKAWHFLIRTDNALAGTIRTELASRAEAARASEELTSLDASALVNLLAVTFLGGYGIDDRVAAGEAYDLRFFSDHLVVTLPRQTSTVIEVNYGEVEELDVGGPGTVSRMSRGQQVGMTLAFGVIGAVVAYSDTKIQTFVRIQTAGSELHFLCTTITPEALRVELSRPLAVIRGAGAGQATGGARQASEPGAAIAELSRLASLVESGLLTREEFDHLKAQLLAGS